MKLYVQNETENKKIYLNLVTPTRSELVKALGGQSLFIMEDKIYHVNNVFAEPDINNTVAGSVTGSLIGILGGPSGVIAGALIGGLWGNQIDKSEIQKVNYFNKSSYDF